MARVGGDWVLQKYVDPDGRVLARGGRKFHLRAHVPGRATRWCGFTTIPSSRSPRRASTRETQPRTSPHTSRIGARAAE